MSDAALASSDAALRGEAERWVTAGQRALRVVVHSAQGSVPRPAGTAMLVAAEQVAGSIGGGHLELQAIKLARRWLADAPPHAAPPPDQRLALGPSLGQCCGGAVTLRYQPLDASCLAEWPQSPARFTLQLHGAGHVGAAIAALLAGLDGQVQWIDERSEAFPASPGPCHIERLCVEPAAAEVAAAPPGAWALVMTHSHDLDLAIVEAWLRRADLGPVGLIGSATKRARFEHRLLARGLPHEQLARLVCPVGLPGITGKSPAVIAVAVAAQLLLWAESGCREPGDQAWASRPSAATSSTRTR